MTESLQQQSTNPSDKGTIKDHHTNLMPMPLINHPADFPVNNKNNSNIMIESDSSFMCQQNSKGPETKKENNLNHQTKNLTGNKEADKSNRQQYQEKKYYNLNKSSNNEEILILMMLIIT